MISLFLSIEDIKKSCREVKDLQKKKKKKDLKRLGGAAGQRTLNTFLKKQDKVQNDVNSEVENQNLNEDSNGEEIEEMLQTSFTGRPNIPIITNVWIRKKNIHEFTECVQQGSKNKVFARKNG